MIALGDVEVVGLKDDLSEVGFCKMDRGKVRRG